MGFVTPTQTLDVDVLAGGATRLRLVSATGRIIQWTDSKAFLAPPTPVFPQNGTSVPSNVYAGCSPVTIIWAPVDGAQCYDLQVALDAASKVVVLNGAANTDVVCPASEANPANSASFIGKATLPVYQGNTCRWRVRVHSVGPTSGAAGLSYAAGQWSAANTFAVTNQNALTSPEPKFPINGSTLPTLSTTLSWNNPSGTSQYRIQVPSLNYDGPAIDLIIGDPKMVSAASYTIPAPVFGKGNYLMLPGATYTWRVRVSPQAGSIPASDAGWGAWPGIRTFATRKPKSATITLNPATGGANPTVSWKDADTSTFYYEVQLSGDPTFNVDPATATSFVYWNLVHGGVSKPPNRWSEPAGSSLPPGKYYWRVRPRIQATPLGIDEPGVPWSATVNFSVQ